MIDAVLLFREALYGTLVIAVGCSVVGVYVVLRRIVFVGAALAQISSAGIGLALWLAGLGVMPGLAGHPLAVSLLVTMAGVAFFATPNREVIPPDASIGVAYAVAAAAGILFIAAAKSGEAHDIYLQGNILGITRGDTRLLLAAVLPVLLAHLVFYKELLFVSFDRETARTMGYHVARWDLALYLTLGVVIACAMQFAGVMLVFNFLVLPAVTGLYVGGGMRTTFIVSVGSALLASMVGFAASIRLVLPSGPAIIAVSGLLTIVAWGARRVRGA